MDVSVMNASWGLKDNIQLWSQTNTSQLHQEHLQVYANVLGCHRLQVHHCHSEQQGAKLKSFTMSIYNAILSCPYGQLRTRLHSHDVNK